MDQYMSWEISHEGEQVAGPQHLPLAQRRVRQARRRRPTANSTRSSAPRCSSSMNDMVVNERHRHPADQPAARARRQPEARDARCRAGTTTSRRCRTGTGKPERMTRSCPRPARPERHAVGHYLLRRLLIAMPSLLGISVVLFTVLALAPGDPFEELALNPNIPPEVRARRCALQFGLDDPVWQRYFRWLLAMLQGDWGFSFISRVDVDTLILQRVPVTLAVIGASQMLALADRAAGRHLLRGAALFVVRPDRQHAGLRRLLAADLLHRPAADPAVLDQARLAAVRLPRRHRRHRLAVVVGAHQAGDHAGRGAGPVPGRELDALRALGGARRDPPRLRDDRAQQGPGASAR